MQKMNHSINSHKTNYHRNGHNHINVVVPLRIIFLLVILFVSAWVRFDGIAEQGIAKGDNSRYIREGKIWADGQPPKYAGTFYRPVSYFLHGMAIRIFGYNDYSIKMLHGIMDMISILLIFIIASILTRDLWAGVASSLIYAFLPGVIYLVRAEMVHVESTFFALVAFLFFMLFEGKKTKNSVKFFLLFISGFSLGLAANTHGDLAFLAPGYVLYLFVKSYNSQTKRKFLKEFLILSSIFTFSFFTPYLLGFLLFGTKKVLQVLLSELSAAQFGSVHICGQVSKPLVFLYILYYLIKYYFIKQVFLIGMLLTGSIFIMIYRKKKKKSDPLLVYFPLILIFSYALLHSCFFDAFGGGRYLMPLVPMVIFIITYWYNKFFIQFLGKYSLIAFIFLFLMIFLVNPKVMPGKMYKSQYRLIYDILKDDVNSKNKLLLAPAAIYSFDRAFKLDLYFGKNAVYMNHLPIKDEYNLKSLKELLKDMDIRYIFLGKRIDRRFIGKDFPLTGLYKRWFRNDKNPYSLEKDLEIIQAYIRSKGGMVINMNRFGKIYYLTGKKSVQKESGLITNGSFENWWKGFPMGEWKLLSGRISRSFEATEGLNSIRFAPTHKGDKKGTRIIWVFRKPLQKNVSKLRVRLDVKAGKSGKFVFFFTAGINVKKQTIKPGEVRYNGKGDWVTLSEDFAITTNMRTLIFHLWLQPGAREPAFVDNLSIIPIVRD